MSATLPLPHRSFRLEDAAGTRRFTVDEYHRMVDEGILAEGEPVELLDGYVVYKLDHVAPPVGGPFPAWWFLRRWTPEEYHRLVDLGIIGPAEKVELLDGYVVPKMPQNVPHRAAVLRLSTRLSGHLPSGWVVMTQCPLLAGGTEPEPDGAVLRGRDEDYDARHPVPADVGIVIEVADSSRNRDRFAKGQIYATNTIPEYWIVNVVDRQVEVYTGPDPAATPPAYRTRTDYRPGDNVPIVLDGQTVGHIPVADLIP